MIYEVIKIHIASDIYIVNDMFVGVWVGLIRGDLIP